ncbi:MAG: SulP family inorganic anion transporter [Acidimicrobiales bacterium]
MTIIEGGTPATGQASVRSDDGPLASIVLTGALVVSMAGMGLALSALVFSGELAVGRAEATASFTIGAGLVGAWLAFRSRVVPLATIPQDAPAVVLAAIVASLVATRPDLDAGDIRAVIGVTTLAAGLSMLVLGRLGLGEAVRFLPTVVVQGFIAGTALLLLRGGVEVTLDRPLEFDDLGSLVEGRALAQLLAFLAVAALIAALSSSPRAPKGAASAAIVGAAVVFYAAVLVASSTDEVQASGWLSEPADSAVGVPVIGPEALGDAWRAIGGELAGLASVLVVTVVALLLNLSALESVRRERVDTAHELTESGVSNMAVSVVGAVPVFHALGDTVLAERMGVRGRGVCVAAGLVTAALGVVGAGVVAYVPLFIAGGILGAVGFGLLDGWVRFLAGPLTWIDRATSTSVAVAMIAIGVIEGVVIGLVLACAVFVIRYSRIDPVRRQSDGSTSRSVVDRTAAEATALEKHAAALRVVELQGYLFFASATRVGDRLRDVASATEVSIVVVDLRFVTGVESGTSTVIEPVLEDLAAGGTTVLVSGPDPQLLRAWAGAADVEPHPTLDRALASAEQRILQIAEADDSSDGPSTPPGWLGPFEQATVPAGEHLLREGDPGDDLVFVLEGTVDVIARSATGARHRVRQSSGPVWVGELGFLRGTPRSADVVAQTDLQIATLTRASFEELQRSSPTTATRIMTEIATVAASRAASLTASVGSALDR